MDISAHQPSFSVHSAAKFTRLPTRRIRLHPLQFVASRGRPGQDSHGLPSECKLFEIQVVQAYGYKSIFILVPTGMFAFCDV